MFCFVVSLMFIDVPNLRLPVETIIFSLHKIVSNYLHCCDGNTVTSIQISYRGHFIEHCTSLEAWPVCQAVTGWTRWGSSRQLLSPSFSISSSSSSSSRVTLIHQKQKTIEEGNR